MAEETTYVVQRLRRGLEGRLWEEMGSVTVSAGTFARTALLEAVRGAGIKSVSPADRFRVLGPDAAKEFGLREKPHTPDYEVVAAPSETLPA